MIFLSFPQLLSVKEKVINEAVKLFKDPINIMKN